MKNRWSDWNSDIQLSLLTLTKVRYRYQTKEGWTEEHCFYKLSFSLISSEFDFEVWCSSFGLCPCCTTMYGSPEWTNQTLTPERPYSVFHIYSNNCAGRWNKGYFICCSRIARCCDILSTVEAEAEACVKIWFFFFSVRCFRATLSVAIKIRAHQKARATFAPVILLQPLIQRLPQMEFCPPSKRFPISHYFVWVFCLKPRSLIRGPESSGTAEERRQVASLFARALFISAICPGPPPPTHVAPLAGCPSLNRSFWDEKSLCLLLKSCLRKAGLLKAARLWPTWAADSIICYVTAGTFSHVTEHLTSKSLRCTMRGGQESKAYLRTVTQQAEASFLPRWRTIKPLNRRAHTRADDFFLSLPLSVCAAVYVRPEFGSERAQQIRRTPLRERLSLSFHHVCVFNEDARLFPSSIQLAAPIRTSGRLYRLKWQ